MATVAIQGPSTKQALRAWVDRIRALIEQLPDDPPPPEPAKAPRAIDRKAA